MDPRQHPRCFLASCLPDPSSYQSCRSVSNCSNNHREHDKYARIYANIFIDLRHGLARLMMRMVAFPAIGPRRAIDILLIAAHNKTYDALTWRCL